MSTLVSMFRQRLGVSKGNAIWRVIGFLFLPICFVVTIIVAVTFFPYSESLTEEIALLPGNHIQVQQILDGEVLVDRAQFLKMAKGNPIFVASGEMTIVYMTKVAGVSYRYNQDTPLHLRYFVSSQKIRNGMLIKERGRSAFAMILFNVISPLFTLFLLFFLIIRVQQKKAGFGSSDAQRKVWWE